MARRGPVAPVRRGSRDASLLAQTRPEQAEGSGHVYVVAGRPMPFRGVTLPVGTEVPGAASWPRLEAWVGARRLRLAGRDEEIQTHADFVAAIDAGAESDSTPVPDPPPTPPPAPEPGPPPTASVEETKTDEE